MNKAARRRCFSPLSGAILAAAFLTGCAGDAAAPTATITQEPTRHAAPTPETAALTAPSNAPADTPGKVPEPEINAPSPEDVIGWSTDALNTAFGRASLVRRDLGAEIWQYRTEQCVLLVFLYPEKSSDGAPLQVEHLDVGGGKDTVACLKSVVRGHVLRTTG